MILIKNAKFCHPTYFRKTLQNLQLFDLKYWFLLHSMEKLNADYWESRYQKEHIGWDIGYPSPALIEYFASSVSKNASILIPGAGHAYEAEWLLNNGYKDISVLDWSETALTEAVKRAPILEKAKLFITDFFAHTGEYNLIMEQTFFCALPPHLRNSYATKCSELLKPKGVLMGLLFDFPLTDSGPPYGGCFDEYQLLFEKYFEIKRLEKAKNSIKPRQGREFFIELHA